MTLQKGIHKISHEDYNADPCVEPSLSRGAIFDLLNLTPAHAWHNHPRLNPDYQADEDSKFDLSTAAHSLFLEGIDIAEPLYFPSWQSSKAKEAREEARLAGKVPLLVEQYQRTLDMAKAAHRQLAASELAIKDLHAEGDSELTYIWKEGETWCRIRPDWISHNNICNGRKLIIDYKGTGASASPSAFKASDHGKDIQYAFYRKGVQAIEGDKPPIFIFLVQEDKPPYLCSFIGLDPQTVELAEDKVQYGLALWEKCLYLNEWPGYPTRIAYVESPAWAVAQWEIKKLTLEYE